HMGLSFAEYEREHDVYTTTVRRLRHQLGGLLPKMQMIERGFLPNFLFTPHDLVVTVGRDGLVVNTAKYLDGQPIVAVNPDPGRIDGILLPFAVAQARTECSAWSRATLVFTRSPWPRSSSTTGSTCWRSTTSTSVSARTCRR